ncbi:hypothetical protein CBR_g40710 [Chara braunii]|uniref:P-type Ca(2+) transporter n=1 Tax=Chara braunii TaxID=69332 RepID=A0A388LUA3_CHABU|nr:hypothetical protein CBR_g40710 [Chara braunii]|eukprot:GBG85897.1 hypothetical protein CBR_g40710 [Chara braunii]
MECERMAGHPVQEEEEEDGKAFPAWARSLDQCFGYYDVDPNYGLTKEQVEKRRERYGWNELEKEPGTPMWRLVLQQFDDLLVKILLLAAVVSFALAYLDSDEASSPSSSSSSSSSSVAGGEVGAAGGVGGSITAYVEPLVILLILIINAFVGVWQENNAEKALEALKEMQSEHSRVLRGGKMVDDLPSRELVPGDIVELRVGDKVPADARVCGLHTSTLRLEQSALTGESVAVLKSHHAVPHEDVELQGKECMVFAGTTVVNGTCHVLVTGIGMQTEIGKIQAQIQDANKDDDETPLKKKINEFGEKLTLVIGAVCVLVWAINYKYFLIITVSEEGKMTWTFSLQKCTYYFKIAVALAVAAIPEGLPAVITTCLALGTRKMAQKNAIVRKLPSVETLGCTTVICSDKTGTLTTNQMSVTTLVGVGYKEDVLREWTVDGTTYNPKDGCILDRWVPGNLDENLEVIASICACCNDAGLVYKNNAVRATGMPTEAALKVLVEKMGVPDPREQQRLRNISETDPESLVQGCTDWWVALHPRLATLEFDRSRKSMSVIVRMPSGRNRLLVKGAVECVLDRCTKIQAEKGVVLNMTQQARNRILSKLNLMGSKALRCLALAYRDDLGSLSFYDGEGHPEHGWLAEPANYASIESDMIFVGMVGLRDPPREEVPRAVQDCRDAGIRIVVITGDNKNTAEAICKEIGVVQDGEDTSFCSITGKDFTSLPYNKRYELLLSHRGGCVFSRAEPKHKQDIVRMLKDAGEIVAMTGDGVNDAPALKLANIGIAMGIAGTEVAKEASDMVLADDNFSTIVAAVAEGRSIYNNMKAFIRYMISSNIGEVASIFLTAAMGMPEGLIPVQLLWVNLVTDGPPATALGFNPPDTDIMRKPPRRSDDQLINVWVFFRYLVIGTYVGLATVGVFAVWYTQPSFMGIDLTADGHSFITFHELRTWGECHTWEGFKANQFTAGSRTFSFENDPCEYFTTGKVKATTLSLSVLVAIEMFNALNALSEDGSLLTMPPWVNPWLLVAMAVSFGLHFVILYVPLLANVFSIVPLTLNEWLLVLAVSLPVILIDEVLKFFGRMMSARERRQRKLKMN